MSGLQRSPFLLLSVPILPFLSHSFLGFEKFHLQSLAAVFYGCKGLGRKGFLKRSKEAVPGRREEKWPERERKLWLHVLAKQRPGASVPVAGVAMPSNFPMLLFPYFQSESLNSMFFFSVCMCARVHVRVSACTHKGHE